MEKNKQIEGWDEIDVWLYKNFGISYSSSSQDAARYHLAKAVAKALWPNKESQSQP